MKIGIAVNGINPARLVEIVRVADELGFESAWRGEHVAVPLEIPADYPYRESGTPPFPPDWPILDTIVLLTYLSAATSRIRFGTGVLIAPLRNPVLLARELTTLDVLSNGRLIVGLGVGWLAPEFDIVGEDFRSRAPRTDELIEILRRLWTERQASFAGEHYSLPPVAFEPKPVSQPHPPILIGGQSRAALRRAARLGDGWYGVDLDLESASRVVAELARLRSESPRAGLPFDNTLLLQAAGASIGPAELEQFEAVGMNRIVVGFGNAPNREVVPLLHKLASRIGLYLSP